MLFNLHNYMLRFNSTWKFNQFCVCRDFSLIIWFIVITQIVCASNKSFNQCNVLCYRTCEHLFLNVHFCIKIYNSRWKINQFCVCRDISLIIRFIVITQHLYDNNKSFNKCNVWCYRTWEHLSLNAHKLSMLQCKFNAFALFSRI